MVKRRDEYLRRFRLFVSEKIKDEPFGCPCPKESEEWDKSQSLALFVRKNGEAGREDLKANGGLCFPPHTCARYLFLFWIWLMYIVERSMKWICWFMSFFFLKKQSKGVGHGFFLFFFFSFCLFLLYNIISPKGICQLPFYS